MTNEMMEDSEIQGMGEGHGEGVVNLKKIFGEQTDALDPVEPEILDMEAARAVFEQ